MGVKIALDAGHGKNTPGKRCLKSIDPKETIEWKLNSRIADKVTNKLSDYDGIETIRVDDPSGKVDVPLKQRCQIANDSKADLYLSIHHNAGANGSNAGGITVYTFLESKHTMQKRLYQKLIEKTSLKGNRTSWDLQANFSVLKYTDMPACLMELGFMDSRVDVPIILTEQYAEQCADGIVEFLIEEYKLVKKAPKTIYKVQVGVYSDRKNAEFMQSKLKALGLDSVIV